ncbi:MAG: class I SAM-dependent methyltransferase [Candidatus Nealsonbacteria bacterium]|nr:class I SAM-dependent methyltransferase [Candidatus Nealsonbacteria bacterium]
MTTKNRTNRPAARRRRFGVFLGVLMLCFTAAELPAKTPTAADFLELVANLQPFDRYVHGNSISVDRKVVFESATSKRACSLIGAESPILAFEENDRFLCVTAQGAKSPKVVRRVILIKPSILIVDDVVGDVPQDGALRWQLSCRTSPTGARGHSVVADTNGKCICSTLWPAEDVPAWTSTRQEEPAAECHVEIKPMQGENSVRCLHVLSLHPKQEEAVSIKTTIGEKAGVLTLTITGDGDTYRFELPCPGKDAGTVAVTAADGKVAVQRRPLPGGILPHGLDGMRLIDRWDRYYRDGRMPPWNNNLPAAPALQEAVEKETIKPCRVVVLGCGSGSNAIFLAKKGFDVTAVDVAPSALGIAMADAQKAKVKVRWVLANVLALPDLRQFDLIFDRGCYHNVRYVDAAGFVASLKQLSRPGTRCFVLSCNRDNAPGVREQTMRDDFTETFDFEWIRPATIHAGKESKDTAKAWSVMLRRKGEE